VAGVFAFRTVKAVRWDGTNGAEVAQVCDAIDVDDAAWTVAEEIPGERLVLSQAQSPERFALWTVPAATPWVVVANDFGILHMLTDERFHAQFTSTASVGTLVGVDDVPERILADGTIVKRLRARLAELSYGGMGVAPAGELPPGTTVVPVPVRPVQRNTEYEAQAFLAAGVPAMRVLSVTGVATVAPGRVEVSILNEGTATLNGVTVIVHVC